VDEAPAAAASHSLLTVSVGGSSVEVTGAAAARSLLQEQSAALAQAQHGLTALTARRAVLEGSLEGEREGVAELERELAGLQTQHAAKAEASMTVGKRAAAAARHFDGLASILQGTVVA
jgi:hypothetical protein